MRAVQIRYPILIFKTNQSTEDIKKLNELKSKKQLAISLPTHTVVVYQEGYEFLFLYIVTNTNVVTLSNICQLVDFSWNFIVIKVTFF